MRRLCGKLLGSSCAPADDDLNEWMKDRCSKSRTSSSRSRTSDPQRPHLTVNDGRGRSHHGAERLRQVDAVLRARRQAGLRGPRRRGPARRREHPRDGAGRARRRRRVPRLPVPARDPRRRHHDVPQGGAQRAAQGARRGRADDARVHQARQRRGRQARDSEGHAEARAQCRLLGRREEAHGDPADGAAASRASASSTRPIPASTSTRCGSSPTASTRCARRTAPSSSSRTTSAC